LPHSHAFSTPPFRLATTTATVTPGITAQIPSGRAHDNSLAPVLTAAAPANFPIQFPPAIRSREPLHTQHPPGINTAVEDGDDTRGRAIWDGWPDGEFERHFNWQEYTDTKDIMVHWAYRLTGGDRKGDRFADTWQKGKHSKRWCLGIITCDNEECDIIVRPQTKPEGIYRQLLMKCQCGAKLQHEDCGIVSELWKYDGGIHYIHRDYHHHARPTHILHLSPDQRARFDAIVTANPKVGPLGLLVGVPGLHGPGESVAEISDIFLNSDRIRKERQRVKKGNSQGGDGFLAEFAKFASDHPGFVIYSQMGEVTVIVMQSAFMASQLVKNGILEGAVNGLISDAAHGFWLNRNSILIVTSCHSPQLFCWVPVIFTYSNGSSAEHYKLHFLALLQSIGHEAEKGEVPITDDLFAGVGYVKFANL
jgi:hypothetical protein